VGGVAFGMCGGWYAVIHAVGLLCAEWLSRPAFPRSSSWSRNMWIKHLVVFMTLVHTYFYIVVYKQQGMSHFKTRFD